jgi:tetratricopeptide (TPR) repeat protein
MARDWDLFAMTSTALVPLVLLVLDRYARATGAAPEVTARFAAPALVLVAVLGVSWVAVNASQGRTVDRFQRILTYDQTHASYAWENLAILQHDSGHLKEAIRTMERAVEVSRNPRQIVRLAVYVEEDGRVDEAIAMLEEILVRRPEFSKARFRLVMFLEKTGQWDRLLPVAKDGVQYSPGDAIYHFFYGECLMRAGRTEEGLQVFRACQNLDLPDTAKQYIAQTLAKHEQK